MFSVLVYDHHTFFQSHATLLSRKIKLSSGVATGTIDVEYDLCQFHDYRTIFSVARDSMIS